MMKSVLLTRHPDQVGTARGSAVLYAAKQDAAENTNADQHQPVAARRHGVPLLLDEPAHSVPPVDNGCEDSIERDPSPTLLTNTRSNLASAG